MSLKDIINQTQREEEALRREWAFGEYMAEPCPKCGRQRLCECPNGKHRCEKCNWVPEDQEYCEVPLL